MTSYAVDDAHGNQITAGLSEPDARRVAQRCADRRGETVYLYEQGADGSEAIEPASTEQTSELHLIAEHPSHGDRHCDPVNPRLLGRYDSRDEAHRAGRAYLSAHPEAWLQTCGANGDGVEDVSRG